MDNIKILWVDDEIDLLKPHIMFLEDKGYAVDTVNNGSEAVEMVGETHYDIIFLDENMPGMDGLETLEQIKSIKAGVPVVMITKSEEESIMEDAIGSKISDYLIKPVNPKQILLTLKKHLDTQRLVSEKTTSNYQLEFRQIAMDMAMVNDWEAWADLYKRLTYWELQLDQLEDEGLNEILLTQKKEANSQFFKFIEKNYEEWLHHGEDAPVMSHTLFRKWVLPEINNGEKIFWIVIDNLRYDQWKILKPFIEQYYNTEQEKDYYSILPTATQYARNAMFAGLMPQEIKKRFPEKWVHDTDDEGKNNNEEFFMADQLKRAGHGDLKFSYHKITNHNAGKKLVENLSNHTNNQFNVLVYNFVDMLSHAKTDMKVIKELADNDKAYRSLTESWFKNSPLLDMIKQLQSKGIKIALTTDHGTINVGRPIKLVGDRNVNTNLRYKVGRNMSYDKKQVYAIENPEDIFLPKPNINSEFAFAPEDSFFAYPNNFNHYVKYYTNTYQHGGISLEEMIVPFVLLSPRK